MTSLNMLLPLEKWAEYPRVKRKYKLQDQMEPKEEDLKRFWSFVEITNPNDCWKWNGTMYNTGYGSFFIFGISIRAHRFSLYANGVEIPTPMFSCHHCDNKRCVNPNHLYVGTCSQNNRDARSRGLNKPYGEDNGFSKLTNKQRHDLFLMVQSGVSHRKAAEQFGIAKGTVWNAIKGFRNSSNKELTNALLRTI